MGESANCVNAGGEIRKEVKLSVEEKTVRDKLRILDLRSCNIGDEGAQALVAELSTLRSLQTAALQYNSLSNECKMHSPTLPRSVCS